MSEQEIVNWETENREEAETFQLCVQFEVEKTGCLELENGIARLEKLELPE
jgi:hypothetical protein